MSDVAIRRLERAAALGDPYAQARLERAQDLSNEFELVTDVCHQWDPKAQRFVEVEYQRWRRRDFDSAPASPLLGQGRVPGLLSGIRRA